MKKDNNLVRLLDLDKDFIIDLKYSTEDNFTGQRVYISSECFLDMHTAKMLIEAKEKFKKDGYKVKVWDAYRPISAQKRLWDAASDKSFVALPPDMSTIKEFKARHMNGLCVDVTLTDLDGIEIEMPTAFDDFTEMASLECENIKPEARKNAEYLRDIMLSVGFEPLSIEWWHFYDRKTEATPYLDVQI